MLRDIRGGPGAADVGRRRGRHVHGAGVIVGVHSRLRNLGLSVVTDICLPDALEPVQLEEIIAVANAAEKKLRVLVRRVLEEMP